MLGAIVSVNFIPRQMGGREKTPGLSGGWYRPHFCVGSTAEYLGVAFVVGPEQVVPGTDFDATVALIYDEVITRHCSPGSDSTCAKDPGQSLRG